MAAGRAAESYRIARRRGERRQDAAVQPRHITHPVGSTGFSFCATYATPPRARPRPQSAGRPPGAWAPATAPQWARLGEARRQTYRFAVPAGRRYEQGASVCVSRLRSNVTINKRPTAAPPASVLADGRLGSLCRGAGLSVSLLRRDLIAHIGAPYTHQSAYCHGYDGPRC